MSSIPKTRIRIQADLFSFTNFSDLLRADLDGYVPKFRAGDDVQFELGFFNNGTLQDLSGIASVTMEIKPMDLSVIERYDTDNDEDDELDNYDLRGPDLSLSPIRSKTVAASALNTGLTQPQWETDEAAHCHAQIALSASESNIAAGDRWLTIAITTNDDPGQTRTVCAGRIRVLGGGLSQSGGPDLDAPGEDYYNTVQSDARYAQRSQNLADISDTSSARDNLGLGDIATTDLIDEDDMSSDTAAQAPSQQSVKAYVDAGLSGKANASHTHTEGDITDLDKYTQAEVNALIDQNRAEPPAVLFSGATGYVGLPASLSGIFAGNATISLLVKLDDGQPSGSQTLIGATDASDDTFTLSVNSSGQIVIAIGDGTSTVTHTSVAYFSDGASDWTWLLVAIDTAAHEMQLYVNGTAYGSAEDISSLDMSAASVPALYLAARNNNGTADQFFKGAVAALDVYNLALTPDAIGNGAVKPFLRWATPADSTVYAASDAGTNNATVDEVNGISDGVTSFDGVLRCYPAAGTLGNHYFSFLGAFEVGQTYKVSMWYYIPSDNTAVDGFDFQSHLDSASQFTDPFTELLVGNVRSTGATGDGAFTSVVGTWTYIEFFIQPNYATPQIELYDGNDQVFTATGAVDDNEIYFKDITITNVGAVGSYRFGEGVGYQPKDQSSNHYDGLLSVTGATWSHPQKRGTLRAFGLDANGGAAYVASSSRDTLPANAIITRAIVKNNDTAIASGALDINRFDGTNRATIGDNAHEIGAGEGAVILPDDGQDLADRRVEIPNTADAGMDDFDIQIDYEVLA